MEGRSGLIKDHKPVNGMYSEADYKELLALAQRNEERVCSLSVTARELKSRKAELEDMIAEVEKERDALKDAMRNIVDTHKLEFLSGRIGYLLVSIAREALAKLEKPTQTIPA